MSDICPNCNIEFDRQNRRQKYCGVICSAAVAYANNRRHQKRWREINKDKINEKQRLQSKRQRMFQ